jgi:hypothetical protein
VEQGCSGDGGLTRGQRAIKKAGATERTEGRRGGRGPYQRWASYFQKVTSVDLVRLMGRNKR